MNAVDGLCHERHPWVGRFVRDIASGAEGELKAVLRVKGERGTVRLAYIKTASGIELETAADNVRLA